MPLALQRTRRISDANGLRIRNCTNISYMSCMYYTVLFVTVQAMSISDKMSLTSTTRKIEDYLDYVNNNGHLKNVFIQDVCKRTDSICKNYNATVCTKRIVGGKVEFRQFPNPCYLFLVNMCQYPGQEFNIAYGSTCDFYHNLRRSIEATTKEIQVTPGKRGVLRTKKTTFSTLYDIDTAFDEHICPMSCPDVYSPVCVSVNRGFGKYFKFFTFVNHCEGDLYYCKHWRDFSPPPDEEVEDVVSSPLGWSYCGSYRYLQFARFSEATSAMGHYGWLAGDYRYSHIMEPHERLPGFG